MVFDIESPPIESLGARVGARFDRKLFTPSDCAAEKEPLAFQQLPDEHGEAIRATNEWVTKFITKRVNKQGSREAICPFVEPSIKKKAIFYAIAQPDEPNEIDSIDQELRRFANVFHALEPKEMPASIVKSVVAIYPETRGPLLLEATDPKRDLKGDLLEAGILAGEFFSTCPFATTFNPKLFALRSPHPMYVLRSFIDTDWRFIAQVERWRDIYHDRFGDPPEGLASIGTFRGRVMDKIRSIGARFGIQQKRKRR
ncbi:MAG: hypothetical protein ACI8UO_000647 [Verrucomicrobiales bacterium]|jgi:hypothetical protein